MKKLIVALCLVLSFGAARADEGMWIPSLIGKNYDEMVRLGLKLSKEDLYSINTGSMKDAIVQFGGGCTAEMISPNGLLITNHHCGYGAIAGLSTVEKNYLDNGFWAKSQGEELPAPGVTVIFLQHIDDVTDEVTAAIGKAKGAELDKKLEEVRKRIEERAAQNGKFVANVKEYFNGNQYLLLTYKKYTDVRLVGTPPKSLGKFGGDTDNWMWPRHTADFSMFRVYAGADNEPADYKAANVPYRPARYLPISTKGVQEGDYAMIFGYPGRTNRYEVSNGIDLAINEVNPAIVRIRDQRLATMRRHMDADKDVYLKLTSSYASIANYWKYYIGQTEQLKRLKVVDQKRAQEAAFTAWAKGKKEYAGLMTDYNNIYTEYRPYARHITYYSEGFRSSGLARLAVLLDPLQKALEGGEANGDTVKKYVDALKSGRKALMGSFDRATEQDLLAASAQMFYQDVPKAQHPDIYERVILKQYGGSNMDKTFADYAAYVFANSFLLDSNRFNAFIKNPTVGEINNDPGAQYALSFLRNYNTNYLPKVEAFSEKKKEYSKRYLKGLMDMRKGELVYPDANSTMRVTYGSVKSYNPQDAVHYSYFTTLDGLMAKYKPNDYEFDVPKGLVDLYQKKDFGRWLDKDGSLHVGFITNNDITGGNSGSPVINGKGEFIGIAFDGNWEAMSGDIAFDKTYKRTIVCDARFILFLIDKLGGASNLIQEMELR